MMSGATAEAPDDPFGLALVFVLAFVVTGLPVLLHCVSQTFAILGCIATSVTIALVLERQTVIVVLTVNIFQNVFVSFASPLFSDLTEVEPMKSYSFLTTAIIWVVVMARFVQERHSYSPFVRRMVYISTALLGVFGFYFVAGLAINPRNAIVYMRNIGLPIQLFQLFLVVAAKYRLALPRIVAILLVLLILCGYLELFNIDLWLRITHGWTYLYLLDLPRITSQQELKISTGAGVVVTNLLDYSTTNLLNTPLLANLDIKMQRLLGPNFHPISFGYLLAALLAFAMAHRRIGLALLTVPLLVMTNAKGPLILAIVCILFVEFARRRNDGLAFKTLVLLLVTYAVLALRSGLQDSDYHVLGLMGGINGFLHNPFGHSLGQGGNLSVANFSEIDWTKFQAAHTADIAVESAVGVMFFQLGIAALAAFIFYGWLVLTAWRLYRVTRAPALAFVAAAVGTVAVNGLFQEEAYFAPLALGLVLGLTGLTFGATDRAIRPLVARATEPQAVPEVDPLRFRHAAAMRR